jgi:hypothetical protein
VKSYIFEGLIVVLMDVLCKYKVVVHWEESGKYNMTGSCVINVEKR